MQSPETADGTLIAVEAARYLAVVEVFRREGREPHWEAEGNRTSASLPSRPAPRVPTNEGRNRC